MPRRLEPDDLYAIKLVDDPQITPDGERIAYVVVKIDRTTYEYHRSIWVAASQPGQPRRYAAGDNDTTPRWSPDGRSLAFVRAPAGEVKPKNEEERDRGVGKPQIWLRGSSLTFGPRSSRRRPPTLPSPEGEGGRGKGKEEGPPAGVALVVLRSRSLAAGTGCGSSANILNDSSRSFW